MDVASFVMAVAHGEFKEAAKIERESNPILGICSLCHHPCEIACIRAKIDEPISIKRIRQFVANYVLNTEIKKPVPDEIANKDKVAIVGSGPAGLMAAYELAKKRYAVTIYEAEPISGGMLTWGIPSFVLDRKAVGAGIKYIQDLGVKIKNNVSLGKELTLDAIFRQGYKAIFLAIGLPENTQINIAGSNVKGIIYALPLLKEVNFGKRVSLGGKVVVIGGGNVAMQAARTAIRLGSIEVHLCCLESRGEMPSFSWEVKRAEEEGVKVHPSLAPREFIAREGKLVGVRFASVERIEFDGKGRIKPTIIEDSQQVIDVDNAIIAIGQRPNLSFVSGASGLSVDTDRGTIIVDPDTLATNMPGVFAGGDIVTGRGLVTEAMAVGREAALSIDRYLGAKEMEKCTVLQLIQIPREQILNFVPKRKRPLMPELPLDERESSFEVVELSPTEEVAVLEAKRCLNCSVCGNCLFYRSQICYRVAEHLF